MPSVNDSVTSLVSALADRYRIEREIGRGGMATVYLADDVRHRRKVAIKVLDPELAAAIGSERFLREIETTAGLQHPHILPLFDSGAVHVRPPDSRGDGAGPAFLYYVMPFVDGLSLRARLKRDGRLSIDGSVRIAHDVAAALGAAHSRGIIHRDIKPENILLQDGNALVADFGIAKAFGAADSRHLTQTGLSVGTPAYMSPEQALGDPAVDARSDVYSLGCVLFEMLTGDPPYAAATPQRAIARRLTEPPPSLTEVLPEADEHLSDVLRRVLAADPEERPATAAAFAELLEPGARGRRATAPNGNIAGSVLRTLVDSAETRRDDGFWIAVLPFKHRGPDPAVESLADGLSEEVVTGLSRFSYLRVIARSSTARYAHDERDVRAVGHELGARYVIDGSVRQMAGTLRLAVQLVDAATGAHLWAETYSRPFSPNDVFVLQDDLADRIVATIGDGYGALVRSMSEALRHRAREQLTPDEAVLRGFGYYERITPEEHAVVRDILESVVQRAPSNGDCQAFLAILYLDEIRNGFNPRPDSIGRAYACARRAVEAAPAHALPHHALALVHFFRKEMDALRVEADRSISLNPLDTASVAAMGTVLAYSGDWERGCALTARCRDLNPNYPGWFLFAPFFDAYRTRDYHRALDIVLKVSMPGYFYANLAVAATYGQLGDHVASREAVRALLVSAPDFVDEGWELCRRWWDRELVAHLMDGLRNAGLDLPAPVDTGAQQ